MLKILIRIVMVLGAIFLGIFVSDRMMKHREAPGVHTFKPYDPATPELARDDRLVVVNYRVEGSEASRILDEILAKIESERTFGDRVVIRSFDVASDPAYARERGVDIEDFRGHLDFFAKEREFTPLRDTVSSEAVHDRIQACLDGLIKRFDRDWKPTVPGMERQ